MTSAQGALYDDLGFFTRYRQMRDRRAGLNDDLKQPAVARMLPRVVGGEALDIGCGDGALVRWLAGAAPVTSWALIRRRACSPWPPATTQEREWPIGAPMPSPWL